jgi:two-component system, cell cycle response regulator DivK
MPARILVIEDDPASLELLRYILDRAGHSVATATDGASGLDAALGNEFDAVFCDVQLPELNGYEVAGRLRASKAWRPVPLVAVTAYSMPGDADAAIAAGFSSYIAKPIMPENFLSDVNSILPEKLRSLGK